MTESIGPQRATPASAAKIEAERKAFEAHLEWAAAEVATWPEWKRNVLGGVRPKDNQPLPSE